jgi:subtilisin-like proprotein convertase family protein
MALTNRDETAWPMRFFDQSPTNALATGQSFNQSLIVSTEAQEYPLRVTLVWTDPPGNPTAAIKLVNDLDLVVSNTVTHDVYYGNNIPAGNDFNSANATNIAPVFDAINNVENVFIPAPLDSNYVVTVFGRRVNVNAVTAHTNNVVQDFALVIASGYATTNLTEQVLQVKPANLANEVVAATPASVVTNGVAMLNQMVGANSPLLPGLDTLSRTNGVTNQWHFYVFTNVFLTNSALALTNGSNVAFVTFMPPNLSVPRNREADIDMYVSRNPALTNLDPIVVASADKSMNRGGTELVVYTNAPVGADSVYYIGIKSEDQEGAEYGFIGLSSNRPFDEDVNGNRIVHGLPVPAIIPDGSAEKPGGVFVFGIVTSPIPVRRVVVTNVISHELIGDLLVNLDHNGAFSVLLNHTLNGGNFSGTNLFIFDDSHQGDVVGSRPSDKPGTLQNFIGMDGAGLWLMTVTDSSLGHTGAVQSLELWIERDLGYLNGEVLPNQFSYYYIDVPDDWYSLSIILDRITPARPLDLYIRRGDLPTLTEYDKFAQIIPPGGRLTLTTNDVPPLAAGRYYIGVYNPNNVTVRFQISVDYQSSLSLARSGVFFSQDTPLPLLDDALTTSTIAVPVSRTVSDVRVGLRIDHPRVSDLVLHLVSPQGTRVLLMENRGAFSTNGLGSGTLTSNLVYAGFAENPVVFQSTNPIASQLIKFVVPPFTTNANTARQTISDFESSTVGTYTNAVDGWIVLTNSVDILNTNLAGGLVSKVLRLKDSGIRRSMNDLIAGQQYVLTFDYLPLSFTGGTNAGAPTFTNSPAVFTTNGMVLTWSSEPGAEYLVEVNTNAFAIPTVWTQIADVIATGTNTTFTDTSATTSGGLRFYRLILKAGPPGSGGNTNWTMITLQSPLVMPTGGGTEISWNSVPGALYRVEATTDFINWVRITEVTATGDTTTVPDPAPAGSGLKFYRVLGLVPSSLPQDLGVRVYLDGVWRTNLTGAGSLWRTCTLPFMAINNFTTLELDALPGRPGVYLDNFVLTEIGKTVYYLPEESLSAFIGENSLGNWMLEISDDRVGATNPPPTLLTWELQLNFVATNFPAIRLVNHVWSTNTVSGSNTVFFIVDVPRSASFATNYLQSLSAGAGLRLLYNRDGLPIGGFGDVTLFNLVGPDIWFYPLSTNQPPDAPLRPGQRYYLGVQNIDPNETNTFRIRVDFDRVNTNVISAIILTNAVPYTNTIAAGALLDYYQFDVSSNSTWATFEIVNPSGNVNLQLRQGVPLPTATQFDYQSANPGTNNELITLFTNSLPVKLSPGTWYLGVNNLESNAVKYLIVATEYSGPIPVPIPLSSGVGYTNTVTNSVDLYEFTVSPDATWASFELLNPSGNVDLYLRKGPSWPTRYTYDYASSNPGTNEELILLFPSSQPVPLSPGNWYLSVVSKQTNAVTYTLVATEYTNQAPNLITLTNGVAYANTNFAANPWDYYLFRVSNQATQALFETFGASGNLDLFVRKGLPLPDATNAFYASRNAGTNDERIVVTNNMAPVSLSPGLWLLGVLNAETNDVTYNIRATEYSPQINPFTNLFIYPNVVVSNGFFWLTWDSIIGATYQVWGREKIEGPGWNVINSNIVATATNTTYSVSTTNSNHFFIVVMSALPPVTPPGDTNLVINPNVVVSGTNFVLSWSAMVGATYRVDEITNVLSTNWVAVSPVLTATNSTMVYSIPVRSGFHFFRVVNLTGPTPPPAGNTNFLINPQFTVTNNVIRIVWNSQVGANYYVQERQSFSVANWTTISPTITATNTVTWFDAPSTNTFSFFRVVQGSVPGPVTGPSFNLLTTLPTTNGFTLQWTATANLKFQVQYTTNLAGSPIPWITLTNVITSPTGSYTFTDTNNAAAFIRFYRLLLLP